MNQTQATVDDLTNSHSISIVIPSYNEANNIRPLYDEIVHSLAQLDLAWEFIFTDDGSTDRTWQEITSLHQIDARVKGIRFSRNFGHQYAIWAGLLQSTGDAVIMMDSDLQHPPRIINELVYNWEQGSKIVHTMRLESENLSVFKKTTSKLFYRIFSYLSDVDLESGMADFRLLDRLVVDDILLLQESHMFLRGLVQWVGYPSTTIKYHSQDRYSGTSKYTVKKMLQFAKSGIMSFSLIPLRLSIWMGIVTALVAFSEMLYVAYIRLFTDTAILGWASVLGVLSFLFGILFILLGVIGEYIGQILIEVRERPRFLIADQVGIKKICRDRIEPRR